jgi:hypothetical protein
MKWSEDYIDLKLPAKLKILQQLLELPTELQFLLELDEDASVYDREAIATLTFDWCTLNPTGTGRYEHRLADKARETMDFAEQKLKAIMRSMDGSWIYPFAKEDNTYVRTIFVGQPVFLRVLDLVSNGAVLADLETIRLPKRDARKL